MTVNLKSLRADRAKLIEDARAIVSAAEAEKRAMSDEENAQFDRMMAEAEKLQGRIEREQKLRDAERAVADIDDGDERRDIDKPDAMVGFRTWLASGSTKGIHGEALLRSLSATTNTEGGYLVPPEQFVNSLIKAVDDQVFVRSLATVYSIPTAASMGAPQLVADPDDGDWTTELQTGSEDSTMSFGKRSIVPHPLAKRLLVSAQLIRQASVGAEALVRDRLAYKFAIAEEKAFMTGNGNGRPLGVFTASNNGISTARDVSTGNTTTAIGADNLREVKYSLKAQYMASGVWIFHRDALKQISKLKDADNQYLWTPGISDADGDRLLGRPVYMSEYAPNTFTTGQYVGIFGDFRHYWIVDALDMQMQRLSELYAETNRVGFIARKETDGAPVLAEAFARVTLA